ncbi:Pycsar system effector family protein [Pontibacter sp. G13]|uniref:Pycsar system effector family protein n=1 Tax=Pontibacter sp. G13 TaxID=3074898 RepID=UPI00288A0E39|nr:Pycsar system effector family protein [Pontibacter sp. G13]WNJ21463.1 DUF5706 domain-containing protein [Pontibacter sp. G13]
MTRNFNPSIQMRVEEKLLVDAEAYAREILVHQLNGDYTYHTVGHTEQVVDAVVEIGQEVGLTSDQMDLIKLAAWFHDLGYIETYIGHEEASMRIARDFLEKREMPATMIEQVEGLIFATRLDQEPKDRLQAVLKDADLYNLALPEALDNSEKIRQEWKVFCDREFSEEEWLDFNYRFFRDYQYYTEYALTKLEPAKGENTALLKKARKKLKKKRLLENQAAIQTHFEQQDAEVKRLKQKLKKIKEQQPDRGIETMFRNTYRTHINLSSIADSKANILLSINAIIISIVFTNAFGIFDQYHYLIYPSILILVSCMTTMVFAILATRPKVNSGVFTREDILAKRTNLLFFGNFYRMDIETFQWGIDQMMKDADYLYGSMSKDIYFLGRVLAKKFMLLRIAYNIFMYGMAASILVFMITYILFFQGVIS